MRILIIGGTGMLAKASRDIAKEGHELILLSRNPDKLAKALQAKSVALDWTRKSEVLACLACLQNEPKVDVLMTWIHNNGLWCLPLFENLLIPGGRSIRIHGSAAGDPAEGIKTDPVTSRGDIIRQHVVLGWVQETEGRRWLSNDEISEGVFKAFKSTESRAMIIGQLHESSTSPSNPVVFKL